MDDAPLLVVKTHAFGDAMLCTPAVRELAGHSGMEVWVLTGPSASQVWERQEGVSRVFTSPFPPSGWRGFPGLAAWSLSNRSALHEAGFTVVFHSSPSVRKWVRFLTGAPSWSCGDTPLGSWEEVFPMDHEGFAGASYARVAGVEPVDMRPSFRVTENERDWAASQDIEPGSVALAPGGGRNPRDDVGEKRWPADKWADLARRLASEGRGLVLVGGTEDMEVSGRVAEEAGAGVLDLTGRTDWGRTAAALERCAAFAGGDSGPAHLAVSSGIPAVVVFGPTSPDLLYPPGSITPVTGGVSCSPCYSSSVFPGCTAGRTACMDAVSVRMVAEALRKVLDEDSCS